MQKNIVIHTKLSNYGEIVRIPVSYSIIDEDNNENIKLITCKVNLDEYEMPEWLSPTEFTIRQVYKTDSGKGVTVAELGNITCKNIDSANFISTTHEHIKVAEKFPKK